MPLPNVMVYPRHNLPILWTNLSLFNGQDRSTYSTGQPSGPIKGRTLPRSLACSVLSWWGAHIASWFERNQKRCLSPLWGFLWCTTVAGVYIPSC